MNRSKSMDPSRLQGLIQREESQMTGEMVMPKCAELGEEYLERKDNRLGQHYGR